MRLGLLAFLPPPVAMEPLLETQAKSELCDLKEPFGDLFQGLQFHRGLLFFAKTIAAMDLMDIFNGSYKQGNERVSTCQARCEECKESFGDSPVACFACG